MTMLADQTGPDSPASTASEPLPPPEPFVTIGSGPRNAWTDPESGLRFYRWQGRELLSVTTIRRLAGMPHRLHQWALNQVVDRATTKIWTLVKMLTRKRRPRERVLEKNRREEASKWLRLAATEERDASAKLGTAVHDAAALGLDPATVPAEVRPRLLQFRAWLASAQPEILGTEFQCWNLTVGYAGTADLLVRFPARVGATEGDVWLIDLKTGKGVFSEHALQLIAYRQSEFVGQDDVVDDRLTALLRQVSGMAVLHLADDHWEFRSMRVDEETWRAFRGLLAFATWLHVHDSPESVTVATRRGSAS